MVRSGVITTLSLFLVNQYLVVEDFRQKPSISIKNELLVYVILQTVFATKSDASKFNITEVFFPICSCRAYNACQIKSR